MEDPGYDEEPDEPTFEYYIGDWYKMENINMIFEVFNQNSKYYREMMNIILKAKNNPPEKGQVHHIIPKCWFKHYNMVVDNSISNTVLLTYEDHKLVHNLAYKCAKEKWFRSKMAYAAHSFGMKMPDFVVSEETKKKLSEAMIGKNRGKIFTVFGKKFYEHYGFTKYKDPKLYDKEKSWYNRHGKCSWE